MRIDTAEAATLLRKVTGKRRITGISDGAMRRALESKGYRVRYLPVSDPRPTLAAWLKDNPVSKRGTKVYLIIAANHYVVVQGLRGGCNQTGGPGPLKNMKKRRGFVSAVMEVAGPAAEVKKKLARERQLQPFKTVENALAALAKAKEEEKAAQQKVLDLAKRVELTRQALSKQKALSLRAKHARLRREAKKAGIRIERDDGIWWVYGPEAVYGEDGELRPDPCEGSHSCHYPDEVDSNIEDYLADLKAAGVA